MDTIEKLLKALAEALVPYLPSTQVDEDMQGTIETAVENAIGDVDFSDYVSAEIDEFDFSDLITDQIRESLSSGTINLEAETTISVY